MKPWSRFGFDMPRSLRLLVAPSATFAEVARLQKGYGNLFGFLALEYAMSAPLEVASHAMRASFSVVAALQGLWASYVHFALPPALAVFALGILLYYARRLRPPSRDESSADGPDARRLDIWAAASVVAYAWVPHVLLVALGVVVAGAGFDHPILPQYPMRGTGLPVSLIVAKALLAFGPSALYCVVAARTTLRPTYGSASPSPVRRGVVVLTALALVFAGCAVASLKVRNEWQDVRPVMPGDVLPAFSLRGVDTPTLDSTALSGRVLLFDFWATWCPPCVAAMPELVRLVHDLSSRGLTLVSVNTEPDNLSEVRDFITAHALTFPVYVDGGALQARLRVETYPTLVLVDTSGTVREVFIGSTSERRLRAAIEPLLGTPQ